MTAPRSPSRSPDEYQRLGIGSSLTAELLADARAAGIKEITALVSSDNPAAVALLRRIVSALDIRFEGPRALDPRSARVRQPGSGLPCSAVTAAGLAFATRNMEDLTPVLIADGPRFRAEPCR